MKGRMRLNIFVLSTIMMIGLVAAAPAQIQWKGGYQDAMQSAVQENKHVFVYFYTTKAKNCARFQQETLANPLIINYLNTNYVNLPVNAEVAKDVARHFGVFRCPTVVILTPQGNEYQRYITYYNARRMLDALRENKEAAQAAVRAPQNTPATGSTQSLYRGALFSESFENLYGWNNEASSADSFAHINLLPGKHGRAFKIHYELRNDEYNYIQIHRRLDEGQQFRLPKQFKLVLHVAGVGGQNNLDIKFVDDDGTNYGFSEAIPLKFADNRLVFTEKEVGYLWGGGGANPKDLDTVVTFMVAVSPTSPAWPRESGQEKGDLYIDELAIVPANYQLPPHQQP